MPDAKRVNSSQLTIHSKKQAFLHKMININRKSTGFSLIEILLSLFFIIAIVTILFSTTGSLFTRRQSDLQSIAAKTSTKEIEYLRGLSFTDFKNKAGTINCTDCSSEGLSSNEFEDLRNGSMDRTISDYGGDQKIYQVDVTINWVNDNGAAKDLKMNTLISENGL